MVWQYKRSTFLSLERLHEPFNSDLSLNNKNDNKENFPDTIFAVKLTLKLNKKARKRMSIWDKNVFVNILFEREKLAIFLAIV